jgi:hypothetical protein
LRKNKKKGAMKLPRNIAQAIEYAYSH